MRRYYTQSGYNPSIEAAITIAGPQAEDQIPEGVRKLLDMPGVQKVAVVFDHGQGLRIELFELMKEKPA